MISTRASGILLHLTSLPSPYGIGDLGPEAYRFADFLHQAGQTYWQLLPLNPTSTYTGNSPYSSYSAFAGNPLLISPELLVRDGLLEQADIETEDFSGGSSVDFERVLHFKEALLHRTFDRNHESIPGDPGFRDFCDQNASWLDACSLFVALKDRFGGVAYLEWPEDVRDYREGALDQWRDNLSDRILREKFVQYLFFRQWRALRKYCNEKGLRMIGDLPIYVRHDSADVWSNPHVFKLDANRQMAAVAGVPPDYFSETGQLWGNPVYDWEALRESGFRWWLDRIKHNLDLFDLFRLDHFRGFVAYWEIPVGEKTAVNGRWIPVPVDDFLDALTDRYPDLPMIAEDLGTITDDVRAVMAKYSFPGMKILQFAFGEDSDDHPYLPHNYPENCVAYTGTHDNNTTVGWFADELSPEGKLRLKEYAKAHLGKVSVPSDLRWALIRLALESEARTCIITVQDILGLGSRARMNTPATASGNWQWRLEPGLLTPELAEKLHKLTTDSRRLR